jgi:hypothetical protein
MNDIFFSETRTRADLWLLNIILISFAFGAIPVVSRTHHGDWCGEVEQIQNGSSWTIQSVEHLLDLIHAQEHEIHPIQCQKIED